MNVPNDEIKLIHSPLTRTHSADGHTLHIQIYRSPDSPWILEIVDEQGTSTVWDDPFDTDTAALEAAFVAIETEGVRSFVTQARQAAEDAEPELLRKLAPAPQNRPPSGGAHDMMTPLSDEELDALELFLLDLDTDEGMTLDMLDGFLHAIVIGPETLLPSDWLPKVWGQQDADEMMLPAADLDEVQRVMGWVMRHHNSIVSDFEQHPPQPQPLWPTVQHGQGDQVREFEDAEAWAYGFVQGVKLNPAAWQPLLSDPQGRRWFRPIGLLGADGFSAAQDALTRTPEQREALAADIAKSLVRIHAFWLPLRQAVQERHTAQRMRAKVGRNEPCPCGSGKKFKKCCGAPSELH
jgi:uncharacterized protein